MKYTIYIILSVGSILATISCVRPKPSIPEVTPRMAAAYEVDESTLVNGRKLYLKHCSQCHLDVFPGEIDPENWRSILPHMAERAQLTKSEEKNILLYVMAGHAEVHGGIN